MPKGPNGEIRPANVTQCAVHVGRIAVKEAEKDGVPGDGSLLSEVLKEEAKEDGHGRTK